MVLRVTNGKSPEELSFETTPGQNIFNIDATEDIELGHVAEAERGMEAYHQSTGSPDPMAEPRTLGKGGDVPQNFGHVPTDSEGLDVADTPEDFEKYTQRNPQQQHSVWDYMISGLTPLRYLTGEPLAAPGFADYSESEGFIDSIGIGAEAIFDSFIDIAKATIDPSDPGPITPAQHAGRILLGDMKPGPARDLLQGTIDVVTDPTMMTGGFAYAVLLKGLSAKKAGSVLTSPGMKGPEEMGVWETGIRELMGMGSPKIGGPQKLDDQPFDSKELQEILQLSKLADKGNKEAIKQIDAMLEDKKMRETVFARTREEAQRKANAAAQHLGRSTEPLLNLNTKDPFKRPKDFTTDVKVPISENRETHTIMGLLNAFPKRQYFELYELDEAGNFIDGTQFRVARNDISTVKHVGGGKSHAIKVPLKPQAFKFSAWISIPGGKHSELYIKPSSWVDILQYMTGKKIKELDILIPNENPDLKGPDNASKIKVTRDEVYNKIVAQGDPAYDPDAVEYGIKEVEYRVLDITDEKLMTEEVFAQLPTGAKNIVLQNRKVLESEDKIGQSINQNVITRHQRYTPAQMETDDETMIHLFRDTLDRWRTKPVRRSGQQIGGAIGNINLSKMNRNADIDEMRGAMRVMFEQDYAAGLKMIGHRGMSDRQLLDEQVNAIADLTGQSRENFYVAGRLTGESKEIDQAAYIYSQRMILLNMAEYSQRLAMNVESIGLGAQAPYAALAFEKSIRLYQLLSDKVVHPQRPNSSYTQSLKPYNYSADTTIQQLELASRVSLDYLAQKQAIKLAEMTSALEDPRKVGNFLSRLHTTGRTPAEKGFDVAHEIWMNSILSGPWTHSVNITSNMTMLTLRPTEKLMSAMSHAAVGEFRRAGEETHEFVRMAISTVEGFKDVFRVYGSDALEYIQMKPESFKNKPWVNIVEEALLKGKKNMPPHLNYIQHAHEMARASGRPSIKSARDDFWGGAINYLGAGIRMFGGALAHEDRFFKLLHYRREVNQQALVNARELTRSDPTKFTEMYRYLKNNPPNMSIEKGMSEASIGTFTQKLGPEGNALRQLIMKFPGGRWVVPFFRTPYNIVATGLKYSPFGTAWQYKQISNQLKAGGAEAEAAIGRLSTSILLPATFMNMMGDHVTGAGNTDTTLGRHNENMGDPPYSIRVGDTWYSYAKIEPMRTILGTMVSLRDVMTNVDMDDEEGETLMGQAVSGIVATFWDVTADQFLVKQLNPILEILESAGRGDTDSFSRFMQKIGASVIPNAVNQTNKALLDKYFRRTDGFLDILKARIPNLNPIVDFEGSESLNYYTTLDGEFTKVPPGLGPDIITSIPMRKVQTDPVWKEFNRLEVPIPRDPMTIHGVKLRTRHKTQVGVYRGKGIPERGVPPLREDLKMVMEMPLWEQMPDKFRRGRLQEVVHNRTELAKGYVFEKSAYLRSEAEKAANKEMNEIMKMLTPQAEQEYRIP